MRNGNYEKMEKEGKDRLEKKEGKVEELNKKCEWIVKIEIE